MKFINSINCLKRAKTGTAIFLLLLSACFLIGCHKAEENSNEPSSSKSSAASKSSERGEQIVAGYLKRDAAPFRKSRLRFTITSETEPAIIYEVDVWRRQRENETATLTHIVKPVEESELSSLIIEPKDQDAVITTYVSSTDQFRETNTNKSFFGGVPAQELLGEWSKYNYRFIGEKDLNGSHVFEVEGKLAPAKHSMVARISAFFRADNYLPVELHLFDSSGKELRTFQVKGYKDDNNRTYISETEIENHVYKTRVVVDVLSMSFPDQIDGSIFTREQLKQIARK
ncbi:MAG: outer membrane lipoprotein-sorting protein [Pyrinomonadaceae bacterium]